MPQPFAGRGFEFRSVMGGLLLQRYDMGDPADITMKTVTKRGPNDAEMESLLFAWQAVQHVKSNAIVLAQGPAHGGHRRRLAQPRRRGGIGD